MLADHDEVRSPDDDDGDPQLAVGTRVRVHPGTDAESCGVVVDDFGTASGHDVRIGASLIADAARRWAVVLDDGTLVFTDSEQIVTE